VDGVEGAKSEGDATSDPIDPGPSVLAEDAADGADPVGEVTPAPPKKPGKGAAKLVKVTEYWADDPGEGEPGGDPQAVRLGASQTALVPFLDAMQMVKLHFVDEPEINGYIKCNQDAEDGGGAGCVLCLAGQKMDEKGLLPVYSPATRSIAILPIGLSSHPGALRPQVMPILRSGKRVAMLVHKPDRMKFEVSVVELMDGMDDGAAVIKAFLRRLEAGEVELGSIYPRLDNRDLAAIPRIANLLKLETLASPPVTSQ
jgi:hypothetical protein